MIGVASVAASLALIPSISRVTETCVWFGEYPFHMGGVLNPPIALKPRLGFAYIPALSIIVAMRKPSRWIVRVALSVDLFALLAWLLLRRVVVSPGGLMIWPDDVPGLLRGNPIRDWPSIFGGAAQVLRDRTIGESIDLLALIGLLMILASLLTRPLPRSLRASAVLLPLCFMYYGWASTMWLERHWGPGDQGRRGLSIIPAASVMELAEGFALTAVLLWLLAIIPGFLRRHDKRMTRDPTQQGWLSCSAALGSRIV
ncbi:hypothetical protein OJF2_41100 [Aquisphaera giovannonii]|uniref:Uncharacterized protein n=2 Tax=Aquisphaera giovannonii TaxID=406548 RepID=A0A5B9W5G6_9BACT|nr:hypothetical protein OJF2_41100 [Aquisphaera giovannonii]